MSLTSIKTMVMTDVVLRLRRKSSLVCLFVAAALAWLIFPDPSSGSTFIAIGNAYVRDTSATIALGSAGMFALLYGLAGFYLIRGRSAEDLRCGIGSIIGSSTVRSMTLLVCRWISGVVYLAVVASAFLLSVLACHYLRGEGPIQLGVYAKTYLLILTPMVFLSVSFAVLFDSVPLLMGKLGDVVFFIIWVAQFSVLASVDSQTAPQWFGPWLVEFTGLLVSMKAIYAQVHTDAIAFGVTSFDPKLPAISLPDDVWTPLLVGVRLTSAAIACCVVLPSFFLFHRYSIDNVKARHAARRDSPIQFLNKLLRPITALVQPAFELAARTPGLLGVALADLALTLCSAPLSILLLLALSLTAIFVHYSVLLPLLMISIASWGVLISDLSTRDFSNGCEGLTGVVYGGVAQRHLRQLIATFLLGLLFVAVIMARLAFQDPLLAVALLAGLCSLSALAQLFGRLTRTPRLFLSLFLFWMYVASQVPKEPMLDVAGFNGCANIGSILIQLGIAVSAVLIGYGYNRRGMSG